MTSVIPSRVKVPRELRARNLSVRDAHQLPGGFIRVVLGGDELEGFESTGPSDHCKLFVPDESGDMQGRHYTPLHMPGGNIAFDIVVHGDGHVSSWAETLPIGDEVRVGGPRASLEFPIGATRLILVGDASAFPPIRRWLDDVPEGLPVDVVLHGDRTEYFETREGVTFHHVPFDPSGKAVIELVRTLDMDETTYVWAAGEATTLIPTRRWLRHESPVPRHAVKVDGYWKQGVVDRDHHQPVDPTDVDE